MLTCPVCGHEASEMMPTDSCQYFYKCAVCKPLLKPNAGDCCVFCSYGDVPCPPIQEARASGSATSCCAPASHVRLTGDPRPIGSGASAPVRPRGGSRSL